MCDLVFTNSICNTICFFLRLYQNYLPFHQYRIFLKHNFQRCTFQTEAFKSMTLPQHQIGSKDDTLRTRFKLHLCCHFFSFWSFFKLIVFTINNNKIIKLSSVNDFEKRVFLCLSIVVTLFHSVQYRLILLLTLIQVKWVQNRFWICAKQFLN